MIPDITRRRLLTALASSPLLAHLPLAAAQPDRGIIALEWLPLELLLALGVMPTGAAELHNYQLWVGGPPLPSSVVDVGLRTEPNMELMIQMKPSLILHSSGYGPAPGRIARIAPTMGFAFNTGDGRPLTSARDSLLALAQRIDRVPQAKAHLAELDLTLQLTRQRLAGRVKRPLLLMSVFDSRHAIVFGQNSLFLEVMNALGIENAWTTETSFWGSLVIGIERLATMKNIDVINFEHGNEALMKQVTASALWQAMPFVRENRFTSVPRVWFYGATLSAMQLCHTLDHALEEL